MQASSSKPYKHTNTPLIASSEIEKSPSNLTNIASSSTDPRIIREKKTISQALLEKSFQRSDERHKQLDETRIKVQPDIEEWRSEASTLFEGVDLHKAIKVVSNALLDAHLHWGHNGLQGSNLCDTSLIYERLLTLYQKKARPSSLAGQEIDRIKEYINDLRNTQSQSPQHLQKRLLDLSPGESLTIPCGWNGIGKGNGHSMIARFERSDDLSYRLIVYNTGAGIANYHSYQQEERGLRILPACSYSQIPQEDLLTKGQGDEPGLIELLMGLSILPQVKEESDYHFSANDFYSRVFGPLMHYRDEDPELSQRSTLWAQRSGSCSWNAIDALILTELNSRDLTDYHPIKSFVKHTLSTSLYALLEPKLKKATPFLRDHYRTVLRSCTQVLSTNGAKRAGTTALPAPHAHLRLGVCQYIQKALNEDEQEEKEAKRQSTAILKKPTTAPEKTFVLSPSRIAEKSYESKPLASKPIQEIPQELLAPPRIDSLPEWLDEVKKIYKHYKQEGRGSLAHHFLENTVRLLPLPNEHTKKELKHLKSKDLNSCAKKLSHLILDYATSYEKGVPENSRKELTAQHILALVHQMTLIIDDEKKHPSGSPKLKDYGLYRQEGIFRNGLLSLSPAPNDAQPFNALKDYFKTHNEGKNHQLCAFPKLMAISNQTDSDDIHYYRALLRSNPFIKSATEKAAQNAKIALSSLNRVTASEETHCAAALHADMNKPKSFASFNQADVLVSNGLEHLISLKRAALACHFIEGRTEFFKEDSGEPATIKYCNYAWPDSYPNAICMVIGIGKERTWKENTEQGLKKGEARLIGEWLKDPQVQAFLKQNRHSQYRYKGVGENDLLRSLKDADSLIPGGHALIQAMSQNRLRPHQLLSHFQGELKQQLHLPIVQFLYELYMYGPSSSKNPCTPLYEAAKDPLFLHHFTHWVKSSLEEYMRQKRADRPSLRASFFLMRQLQTLSELTWPKPLIPLDEELSYYSQWLNIPGWSQEDRALIHLHRAASLAVHSNLEGNKEALAQFFESWVLFQQTPIDPESCPSEVVDRIQNFLHSPQGLQSLQALHENKKTRAYVLTRVGAILDLPKVSQEGWEAFPKSKDPSLFSNTDIHVQLLTGDLHRDGKRINTSFTSNYTEYADFQRVFGTDTRHFLVIGGVTYFTHPHYGRCRAWKKGDELVIEKEQKKEGEWATLISPDIISHPGLSTTLIADHSHWLVKDEKGYPCIEIRSLKNGALRYHIDADGVLQNVNDGNFYQGWRFLNLEHFETGDCIEKWKDGLELPRLQLLGSDEDRLGDKLPLKLGVNSKGYTLEAFPSHHIPWEQPSGLLGTTPNYLYLKGPQPKLLVPMQPVIQSREFSTHAEIQRDPLPNASERPKHRRPLRLSRFALTFDIRGNKLVAKSEVGKTYLAYLYLCQRRYADAFTLLQRLERQAPQAAQREVLQWILAHHYQSLDLSPDAAAVRLLAAEFLFRREEPTMKQALWNLSSEEWKQLSKNLEEDLRRYQESHNHIQERCLLEKVQIRAGKNALESIQERLEALGISPSRPFKAKRVTGYSGSEFPNPGPSMWKAKVSDSEKACDWQIQADLTSLLGESMRGNGPSPGLEELLSTRPESWLGSCFITLYEQALSSDKDTRQRLRYTLWMIGAALQKRSIPNDAPALFLYQVLVHAYQEPKRYSSITIPPVSETLAKRHRFFMNLRDQLWKQNFTFVSATFSKKPAQGIKIKRPHYPRRAPHSVKVKPTSYSAPQAPLISLSLPDILERKPLAQAKTLRFPQELKAELPQAALGAIKKLEAQAEKGLSNKQKAVHYQLKDPKRLKDYLQSLIDNLKQLSEKEAQEKSRIAALLSPHNRDIHGHLSQHLSAAAGGIQHPLFGKVLRLFLRKDPSSYTELHEDLNAEDCLALDQTLLNCFTYRTEIQHLERLIKASRELQSLGTKDSSFQEKVDELGALVDSQRAYDPAFSRAQLVFEAIDVKRIRGDQGELLRLIEDNPLRNNVFELQMAGGKTSVIACIWGHLVAAAGYSPLLLVPEAQLSTVCDNLRHIQKEAFDQDIIKLDFRAKDLNHAKLKELCEEVDYAAKYGQLMVSCPETLQQLELHTLSLADQVNRLPDGCEANPQVLECIGMGQKLVAHFRKQPRAFMDEISLLLAAHKEVNFPVGPRSSIPVEHAQLVRRFLELLSTGSLEKKLRLRANKQCEMTAEEWESEVRELLIQEIANYTPLGLEAKEQKQSFRRFLNAKISPSVIQHLHGSTSLPLEAKEQKSAFQFFLKELLPEADEELKRTVCAFVHTQLRSKNEKELLEKLIAPPQEELSKEALADKLQLHPFELRSLSYKIRQKLKDWALKPYNPSEEKKEDSQDLAFLGRLQECASSQSPLKKMLPELVVISKILIDAVLPSVLKKRVGRNLGKAGDKQAVGRVTHYVSRGNPGTTDFALAIEGAACYNLSALVEGVSTEEIRFVAEAMDTAARSFMDSEGESYERTAEAQEFEEVCGIPLARAGELECLKKAQAHLMSSPSKLLDFQTLMIIHRVHCYTECLTSNASRFLEQLPSVFGGTGTPWNREAFSKGLSAPEAFISDERNAGKLLYTLMNYARSGESEILPIKDFAATSLVTLIQERGYSFFVDPGGRLEDSYELAQEIITTQKNFDAVLFYHRKEGETNANRLALWRKGQPQPNFIHGSRKADIEAHGVNIERCFFLIDEGHSVGTDFPIPPHAKGLAFGDPDNTSDEYSQAAARARLIEKSQRIDYGIAEESQRRFLGSAHHPLLLFLHAELQSQERLIKELLRSAPQKVINAVQQLPLNEKVFVDYANSSSFKEIGRQTVQRFSEHRELLITRGSEDWWQRFGLSRQEESVADSLLIRAEETLSKLNKKVFDSLEHKKVLDRLEAFIQTMEANPLLCGNTHSDQPLELDAAQEVSIDVDVSRELEMEVTLQRDLMLEYQRANGRNYYSRRQKPYSQPPKDLLAWGKKIQKTRETFTSSLYEQPYNTLFSSNFYLTYNFSRPFTEECSVFSQAFGNCEAVLVYPKGKDTYDFVGISKSEAEQLAEHKFTKDDPWLINQRGALQAKHPLPFPYQPEQRGKRPANAQNILRFLLELNLFNGNAAYLVEQRQAFRESLVLTPLLWRYLRIKVERDSQQKSCFLSNPLFTTGQKETHYRPLLHPKRHHQILGELCHKIPKDIAKTPPFIVPSLGPKDIPKLNEYRAFVGNGKQAGQLDFLVTNEQLSRAISSEQLAWSRETPHYQTLVQNLDIKRINSGDIILETKDFDMLTPKQLKNLSPRLVPNLSISSIQKLTEENQIQAITDPEMLGNLKDGQLTMLSSGQWEIFPECYASKIPLREILVFIGPENFPKRLLPHVNREQLAYLPTELHPWVGSAPDRLLGLPNLNSISDEQIRSIREADLIERLPDHALKKIDPKASHLVPAAKRQLLGSEPWFLQNVDDFKGLSEQQLRNIRDPQLVGKFENEQLELLDISLLKYVPDHLVKYVGTSEDRLTHLKSFDQLSSEQIKAIRSAELIERLTVLQLKSIAPDAAPLVPVERRHAFCLNQDLLNRLPNIEGLSFSQKMVITNPDLIPYFSDRDLSCLNPELIPQLPKERRCHLFPNNLQHLGNDWDGVTDSQVENITNIETAQRVPESKLKLLKPELVAQLPIGLRPYLSMEQLLKLPDLEGISDEQLVQIENPDLLAKLKTWQAPKLLPKQVALLQSRHLIQGLEDDQLQHLPGKVVQYVDLSRHHLLTTEQKLHLKSSNSFTAQDVQSITNADLLFKIPDLLLKYLCPDLVPKLPVYRRKYLSPQQLPLLPNFEGISSDQLFKANDVILLDRLDNRALSLLGPGLVPKVPVSKRSHLEVEQWQWLPDLQGVNERLVYRVNDTEMLGKLLPKHFSRLLKNQVKQLRDPKVIEHLEDQQIQYLDMSLVPHVPLQRQLHLKAPQWSFLSNLKGLTPKQISEIDDSAILDKVQDSQIKSLSPSMVARLPERRRRHLEIQQLEHLANLRGITEQQLSQIQPQQGSTLDKIRPEDQQLIEQMSEEQREIWANSTERVNALSPQQLNQLSRRQFALLNSPEKLRAVGAQRIQDLNPQILAQFLENEENRRHFVPLVRPEDCDHLPATARVCRLLNREQIHGVRRQELIGLLSLRQRASYYSWRCRERLRRVPRPALPNFQQLRQRRWSFGKVLLALSVLCALIAVIYAVRRRKRLT